MKVMGLGIQSTFGTSCEKLERAISLIYRSVVVRHQLLAPSQKLFTLSGFLYCHERAVRYRVPLDQKPEGLSLIGPRCTSGRLRQSKTSCAGSPFLNSHHYDGEEGGVMPSRVLCDE